MNKLVIEIPELSLVTMVGSTSSGKTSFAHKHFKPTEVLSSDFFRAMISDDENNQSVSSAAFELLYDAANKRLDNGKLTVIDATGVEKSAREKILNIARAKNVPAVAIVLNMPESVLLERNRSRPERNYPESIIHIHLSELKSGIDNLQQEGFQSVYIIDSVEQLSSVEVVRHK